MTQINTDKHFISKEKIANSYLFAILSFVILVIIDQFTKLYISSNMELHDSISVIDDVFEIYYIHNPGAAWGILADQQLIFYICTIFVLILGIVFYIRCVKSGQFRFLQIALILILSGATGNFIDRLQYQYVIDFLYFKLIDFPVFNIADCYITIGFGLTMILTLFVYKENDMDILTKKAK